ncbi:cell division protein MukB [Vibrio sp. UCD-FRSSP16_10]|uniref:chromosome partition protein MukB n=1 Tax=unclassified Vibrio TaxID=2614977 RepID=UPI0007FCDBFC|nr:MULTISPECIES: chromosome partition protein MukB [unclassified Vibrio]OBT15947.1 cell division protein MukB [Vibrio sp. UCD-FRSSP16_10]OBT17841.1 cell division protein MukB [Vibrio sp. UCD-FRSSP16_30]
MIERGKYQSLTMVNWNGFFARTFDIDSLVTTLSGGNGAGKSTTMAAFITTLIPDQSLLHFRNTTEAGSSQASRDKGLYGKLQPGVCYAALEVVNSRNQRLVFAVKLQQIAGRDKKVDIKPFLIQGLPSDVKAAQLFIETINETQAKVCQLNDVKERVAQIEGAQFKAFNSITDYHAQMFDFGVVPKKLRNSSDRSKFYRLIEASLYGGISSTITRSLRDYLLPQNGGVKKAFQDMESALRENRITLEAIKNTQADRDLFKHLLTESTSYVAADYMRHANQRRSKLEATLGLRSELFNNRQQILDNNALLNATQQQLDAVLEEYSALEQDHQSATDYLQLVQSALQQQQKIARYEDDLVELSERLEEQIMVVEEAQQLLIAAEEQSELTEQEVDSLKSQLADYQQALDVQQTRALQYQQAIKALQDTRELCGLEIDSVDFVPALIAELSAEQQSQTSQILSLKHKLDINSAGAQQFNNAFNLVKTLDADCTRNDAASFAKSALAKAVSANNDVQQLSHWQSQKQEMSKALVKQKNVQTLVADYQQQFAAQLIDEADLEVEYERQSQVIETAEQSIESGRESLLEMRRSEKQINSDIQHFESIAPKWIKANDALTQISEHTETTLTDAQSVMAAMQQVLETEKSLLASKDALAIRRSNIEKEIEALAAPGGANDARLKALADSVGGVLLSEIYDDITLQDAPYFSAMYGPARHAIVVSDMSGIKERLVEFDDCPDDVYILEGDVDAFDDSQFEVEEFEGAVCVQVSEQQLRFSRFPKVPLFGRAARESRLETLREERDQLVEDYAKASFDAQKAQRLYQSFNDFVANHAQVAFEDDPEQSIHSLRSQRNTLIEQLSKLQSAENEHKQALAKGKKALFALDKISPSLHLLEDVTLAERVAEVEAKLQELNESKRYLERFGKTLQQLEPIANALDADPEQFDALQAQYDALDKALQLNKQKTFALSNVLGRKAHFAYADSVQLLDKSSELSEQLKLKLATAEQEKDRARVSFKQTQQQFQQYNQLLATLKSSHQAKSETVQEFRQELNDAGVILDEGILDRAHSRKEALQQRIETSRGAQSQMQKTLTATEMELRSATKALKKQQKDYQELRTFVVTAKAGWCSVLKLAREHDVERRLHKRELAYLSEGELRSMSDKSLGALRLAVANDDSLRDSLRASEDTAYPERKVLFYIAVYQYLRERIRQDIIRTDDPVEAIEEMEVELGRLTEELNQRENRLAISSESVSSIIKKTIQREQNRIRILNQGLSNIHFGQVKGVRLNVEIRESHQILLDSLANPDKAHQQLFDNSRLTFSEAMAKLFQRVNPHIDMGQRSPQILGEELLDYRNYLAMGVEVNRGSEGWLQAESGALSTGEAIGTGQSILLMVVQSWEEESRRLRSKDIVPCRLLFLDEAARLDAKSIATLFELCDRLNMQLLIAAPENISPEKGTTYKLVRKVFKDHEHVHVVGLRGFGQKSLESESVSEADLI